MGDQSVKPHVVCIHMGLTPRDTCPLCVFCAILPTVYCCAVGTLASGSDRYMAISYILPWIFWWAIALVLYAVAVVIYLTQHIYCYRHGQANGTVTTAAVADLHLA